MTGPVPDEASGHALDQADEPVVDDAVAPTDAGLGLDETGALPWERVDWIACAVLLVATIVLVGLHVRTYPTLSPTDELQHLDYVIKAGEFDPPHRNDLVGQEALGEAACRGVDVFGYIGPKCGATPYENEDFQENGVNTAAGQYPIYYTITGVGARAFTDTGILASPVTAARMMGSLWVGAAWAVLWYVMSLLGIARVQRGVAIALFMATPLTLFHAATINADTALLLSGALVLLATLQFERGRLHGAWLIAAFFGLYLLEPTNVLAMTVAAGYLALRSWSSTESTWWRRAVPLLALVLVVVMRFRVYNSLRAWLFPPSPRTLGTTMFRGSSEYQFEWGFILDQFGALFSPLNRTYLPPLLRRESTEILLDLTDWVAIGALLAVALLATFQASPRAVALARLTIPALILAGPFYSWSFAHFSRVEFAAQGRFGLPLFVLIVVAVGASLRSRTATAVVGSLATVSLVNTVILVLAL